MSDQVTRAEFTELTRTMTRLVEKQGELVAAQTELVNELKHTNENHHEVKNRMEKMESQIIDVMNWRSSAQVYLDDAKAGRNTFIKLIVTFLVINSASTYLINILSSGAGQ